MKVLFITHKYPPSVGGMENQSYHLINGIGKMISKHHIIYDQKEPVWKFFYHLRSKVKTMLQDHPDITHIHLNDGLMAAFCYLLRVDFEGRKVFATFHGLDVVFPLGVYQKYIFTKMTKKMDKIFCVSRATQDACVIRNVPKEKIAVVHNGVDVNTYFESSSKQNQIFKALKLDLTRDKIILTLGRPVKRKGFSWFATEVMSLLDDHIKMVHVGNVSGLRSASIFTLLPKSWETKLNLFLGKTDDSVSLITAHMKNPQRVILAGRLSDEERDQLIQAASVVVLPNIVVPGDMEGFGLAALEAAVMGKTVLVSDLEGMKDAIIDGKNGYRIETGNARVWADSICAHIEKNLLHSKDVRDFTIQNYSWEKMCLGYVHEMMKA